MRPNILKPFFLLIAAVAAIGAIVMLLWNAIIPAIIGWGMLSYLQAVGLLILCRLLFGNVSGSKQRIRKNDPHSDIHNQLKGMSKEEKRDYIKSYMAKMNSDANE